MKSYNEISRLILLEREGKSDNLKKVRANCKNTFSRLKWTPKSTASPKIKISPKLTFLTFWSPHHHKKILIFFAIQRSLPIFEKKNVWFFPPPYVTFFFTYFLLLFWTLLFFSFHRCSKQQQTIGKKTLHMGVGGKNHTFFSPKIGNELWVAKNMYSNCLTKLNSTCFLKKYVELPPTQLVFKGEILNANYEWYFRHFEH